MKTKFYFLDFEFSVLCGSKLQSTGSFDKCYDLRPLSFLLIVHEQFQDSEDFGLNDYLKSIAYIKNKRTILFGKDRRKTHK